LEREFGISLVWDMPGGRKIFWREEGKSIEKIGFVVVKRENAGLILASRFGFCKNECFEIL
jgi:hypothetical protein